MEERNRHQSSASDDYRRPASPQPTQLLPTRRIEQPSSSSRRAMRRRDTVAVIHLPRLLRQSTTAAGDSRSSSLTGSNSSLSTDSTLKLPTITCSDQSTPSPSFHRLSLKRRRESFASKSVSCDERSQTPLVDILQRASVEGRMSGGSRALGSWDEEMDAKAGGPPTVASAGCLRLPRQKRSTSSQPDPSLNFLSPGRTNRSRSMESLRQSRSAELPTAAAAMDEKLDLMEFLSLPPQPPFRARHVSICACEGCKCACCLANRNAVIAAPRSVSSLAKMTSKESRPRRRGSFGEGNLVADLQNIQISLK